MKRNIDEEVRRKNNAVTFFRDLFSDGYNLKMYPFFSNEEFLEESYERYNRYNFYNNMRISRQDEDREARIKDGYNYIKEQIEKLKTYELDNKETVILFEQFYEMTDEIGGYRFIPHSNRSVGYKQNKATDDMLMNLSLFEPIIKTSLRDIDEFLSQEKDEEYLGEVRSKLIGIMDNNDDKIGSLQEAEYDYHNIWEGACRGNEYNYRTLGEAKREFRKEKNNCARRVIDFAREIVTLDQEIMKYKFNELRKDFENKNKVFPLIRHSNELVDEYEDVLRRIVKGPNYYAYLTKEEIEENTKKNKEYKKVLKR